MSLLLIVYCHCLVIYFKLLMDHRKMLLEQQEGGGTMIVGGHHPGLPNVRANWSSLGNNMAMALEAR